MLALLTAAVAWLLPPPVLPLPSASGPEGPPRPYGVAPPPGPAAPAGTAGFAAAQDRALLDGPFPRGGLLRGVSDGTVLLDPDAGARTLELRRIVQTGARLVRIPVDWRDVVDAAPASGFAASDPASPPYHFAPIDSAVTAAVAAGLEPMLVISHAPVFAEAKPRWAYAYPGSWAPDPTALGQFAAALARRYDGSFADPSSPGRALPEVRIFQAWNEPNLARYLEPQWVRTGGRWSAFSPLLYREMLDAFYAGVKSVAPADVVVSAGLAPNGERAGLGRMAPVVFLRALLCLQGGSCRERARFDVLAIHPLSVEDPDRPASSALDVAVSDIGKVRELLDAAERRHTVLPDGRKGLWVTELNWESDPPARSGVPARVQALWISRALHRLWVAGVGVVAWQFLIDPYPSLELSTPTGATDSYQRPAGLYSAGPGGDPALARPKPFLRGFELPFDPLRLDRRQVRVWALLSRPGAPVLLQRLGAGGLWRTIARLRAGADGVLNQLVALAGAARLRLDSGALSSASAAVGSAASAL